MVATEVKKDLWPWLALGAFALLAGGGGTAVILSMGTLTAAQIASFARTAGFSGQDLITAVSIALAESSGNPNSKGDIDVPGAGDASYGLWQVNSHWHPEYGPDFTVLFDPQTNADAAYAIYRAAGGFLPWSTFKNGAYTAYLQGVNSALTA